MWRRSCRCDASVVVGDAPERGPRCPRHRRSRDQLWTMDFASDAFTSGRKFRTLNLMDGFTREALEIEPDTSLPGQRVVRVLEGLKQQGRKPGAIVIDNGPEFVSQVVDQWAYENGVQLHFIEPGSPWQNGYIESFNGKFRDECLNENWFLDLADARRKIAEWKWDYNFVRPHSALGYMTPIEFAARWKESFAITGVGQGTSNAGPLPHAPIPATHHLRGEESTEKVSLSLD